MSQAGHVMISCWITVFQIIKPEHGGHRLKSKISRAKLNKYIERHGGFTNTRSLIQALTR